jgi:hypothetical protein
MALASRNWVFTLNNPKEIIDTSEETWSNNLKLLIAIPEIAPETETIHYQGYLELKNPRQLIWLKNRLQRAHFEIRRGSRQQAANYVMKTIPEKETLSQSELEEHLRSTTLSVFTTLLKPICYPSTDDWMKLKKELCGSQKSEQTQTQKLILQQMKTMIRDQKCSDLQLCEYNFQVWCKNFRALERYRVLCTPPRNEPVEVIVIQGPTGTGKSKYCMENYPNAYWKQRSNWWCNYSGEDTVIIDEFYGWLPFDLLLRICDRYPLLVETKGGQVQFVATKIIITTNAIPNTWYKNSYFKSFVRRVTKWMVFPVWGEVKETNDYASAMQLFVNNDI